MHQDSLQPSETPATPICEAFAKIEQLGRKNNSCTCVGLDTVYERIPAHIRRQATFSSPTLGDTLWQSNYNEISAALLAFNIEIIEAVNDLVCAVKPNYAMYEAYGVEGIQALHDTIAYIKLKYPELAVILDYKRADIGNTNIGSVQMAFDYLNADIVTVNPYFGKKALQPFLARTANGIFVLVRTSNEGADEFQDLVLADTDEPLYLHVARRVVTNWNDRGNCGIVVGATTPDELAKVRQIVGPMPILIPGLGAQGGDVQRTILAGRDHNGGGMITNSSRDILYAYQKKALDGSPLYNEQDFALAARNAAMQLRDETNQYRFLPFAQQ